MATIGLESVRWYDQYRANNGTVDDKGAMVGPPIPYGVGGWIDLSYSYNITNRFYEVMTGAGVNCPFYFVGGDVWETDIKDTSLRGDDVTYADSVDLWFFTGHSYIGLDDGDGAQIVLNTNINNWSSPSKQWKVGDNWNCEWIALYTCESLRFRDTAWENYANIFQRLHIMLGSWEHSKDGADFANCGRAFAENLVDGDTVQVAWFDGIGVDNGPAALSAETADTWHDGAPDYGATTMNNDHFWGHGNVMPDIRADKIGWLLYRWRHHT